FFSSRRRHTRFSRDWSSDVCSSDLFGQVTLVELHQSGGHGGITLQRRTRDIVQIVENKITLFVADHVDRSRLHDVGESLQFESQIGRASCRELWQISLVS